jgi:hypothetical protein
MTRFQLITNRILIGWGILCAGIVLVLAIAIAYQFGPGKSSSKTASSHDVGYIMNWCQLGDDRIEEVLHSYISTSSFSGDHIETHAIKITEINLDELEQNEKGMSWFRGDEATGVVGDALEFVKQWIPSDDIPWFIPEEELRTPAVYVYPRTIFYHGTTPTAVKLIFVRPEDKTVFYFASKMQ